MSKQIAYSIVKQNLEKHGYYLDITHAEYTGVTTSKLICHDDDGYRYVVTYDNVIRNRKHARIHPSNPFSIENINTYLRLNNLHFVCVSDEYRNKRAPLDMLCTLCGQHICTTWDAVNRKGETRRHIICENCDGRNESLHAIILKQLFTHYYPDTVEEDGSCINPATGRVLPTDIVNHRLKIAVEIQSQWHDDVKRSAVDAIKRNYWIDRGYAFYAPDIRDYSILEMCQLFFDIDEIPSFVDFHYRNKLNIVQIQNMLCAGHTIPEVADILSIDKHRIYDACSHGKIELPSTYIEAHKHPVVQIDQDGMIIAYYDSLSSAERANGYYAGALNQALNRYNKNTYKGYIWKDIIRKDQLSTTKSSETAGSI